MKKGFVLGFLSGVLATIGSSVLFVALYDHDFFRSRSDKKKELDDLYDEWLSFDDENEDDLDLDDIEEEKMESLKDSSL